MKCKRKQARNTNLWTNNAPRKELIFTANEKRNNSCTLGKWVFFGLLIIMSENATYYKHIFLHKAPVLLNSFVALKCWFSLNSIFYHPIYISYICTAETCHFLFLTWIHLCNLSFSALAGFMNYIIILNSLTWDKISARVFLT